MFVFIFADPINGTMSFAGNPSMFEALRAIVVASAAAPDDDPAADAAVSAAIRKLYPDIPEPPQRNPNAPRSLDEVSVPSQAGQPKLSYPCTS